MEHSKTDQIVKDLKEKIEQGFYYAGQPLPSERTLAKYFQVSRTTIRSALSRLQADSYIDIRHRRGAFVRSTAPKDKIGSCELQQHDTFMEVLHKQGREVLVRFLEPSKILPAGEVVAKQLNISPDTEIFRRYRVQIVDLVPYRIMEGYYLASLLRELCERDQELYPLQRWDDQYVPFFTWLREQKNFFPSRVREVLKARMPTANEAQILNISRNQPVTELHRWVWGQWNKKGNEILYEYSRFVCNSVKHEFEYSYDVL